MAQLCLACLLGFSGCSQDSGSPDSGDPDAADAQAYDAADGWDAGDPGSDPDRGDDYVEPWVELIDGTPARWVADCGEVKLSASALDEKILRLTYSNADPQPAGRPSYAVVEREWPDTWHEVALTETEFSFSTRALVLVVYRDRCRLTVSDSDGNLLLSDLPDGGYQPGTVPGESSLVRSTSSDEHFFGLGEKAGGIDRRGRRLIMRNTDPYDDSLGGYPPDADPLYLSIPFFIGLRGSRAYGMLTDNSYRLEFDMGESDSASYRINASGGQIDQYLVAGPTLSEVLAGYGMLTGYQSLPPRWSLGYHQSRWGYYPDARVREVCSGFRDRNIPADGIWLDIQHMDGFRSWTWDPAGFSDPGGLIAELEAAGFKTTVIVDPGIKLDPGWDVYDSGLSGGVYLKGDGGQPYVGEVWPGPAVFPDFTSSATRSWWASLVTRASGLGVRGIWLDMNEPTSFLQAEGNTVPDDIAVDGDGVPGTMKEAHNLYALCEARATYRGMQDAEPDRRPFILTRSGFAGIQRYAAVWTGDAPSSWDSLTSTLPMLLGLGLSGVSFVGSDVGGYSGNPSAELFARWIQLGSISPFFRDHVTQGVNDQEPWAFGPEVEDISRAVISERYRLLPTLYSLFKQSSTTGAPVLRPLVYEFQDDPATHDLDDQAMLGPWLLYAPVLEQGAQTRRLYLPAGRWFEFHSGAIHDGPATIETPVTLAALPAYVREGAIIARGPLMMWSDQLLLAPLYLDVYPGDRQSTFVLYEDGGDSLDYQQGDYSSVEFSLQRTAGGAELIAAAREGDYLPPQRTMLVRLRRADQPPTGVVLTGETLPEFDNYDTLLSSGRGWWYDHRDLSIVAAVPDQPPLTLEFSYQTEIVDPSPPVAVFFRVTLPPGTPTDTPIHLATSANDWNHQPLEWGAQPDTAEGLVELPRGEWFFYKYTRGDWATVEKWADCSEATNRYGFASAHPERNDVVENWADWCR